MSSRKILHPKSSLKCSRTVNKTKDTYKGNPRNQSKKHRINNCLSRPLTVMVLFLILLVQKSCWPHRNKGRRNRNEGRRNGDLRVPIGHRSLEGNSRQIYHQD